MTVRSKKIAFSELTSKQKDANARPYKPKSSMKNENENKVEGFDLIFEKSKTVKFTSMRCDRG